MRILYEKEAEEFLERHRFSVAKRLFAHTEKEAVNAAERLHYPVALKISSHTVLHKSDVGGVAIDLRTKEEALQAFRRIKKIKGYESVLVQHYRQGESLILGIKNDPTFGHTVMIGTGGIYTEILKDVSFRVCPLTQHDAKEMIRELKIFPILNGARGKKPVDFDSIAKQVLRLSWLAGKHPEIQELDINPLIVTPDEAAIVDARIVFA